MQNDNTKESVITGEVLFLLVLFVLTFVLMNPLGFFMPSMMVVTLLGIFFIIFGITSVFVWREHAHDEREVLHRGVAGRVAYLAGSAVLALGIIFQEIGGHIDPWIVYALAAMIGGKIVTLMILKFKN